MTTPHDALRCPTCHALMQVGFLPVSDGLHFMRGDGKAAANFAEDLPGTHAVMRSNRLLAWRCKPCQVVVFKYGRDNAKHIERITALDEEAAAAQSDSDTDSADS
ncbi:PF20097 family protein [Phycisphaeraceae bacterium D3-23]